MAEDTRPHSGDPTTGRSGTRLDITSMLGLPVSLGLILIGQAIEGGSVKSLLQPTAALIVLGGTFGAVLLSFSLTDVRRAGSAFRTVLTWDGEPPSKTIDTLMELATQARKGGILSLEDSLPDVRDPFLRKALRLAVDGTKGGELRGILEIENENREEYDEIPAKVFEAAGAYAPTVGILGAVLGLIHVMENLSDPAKLGHGIAVAFVATVYGVAAANLLFLPMATKVKRKARLMFQRHELMLEGVLAIQEGLSPRHVYDRLYAFAAQSVPTFDEKRRAA
jgi:chemotaxis protein MotA